MAWSKSVMTYPPQMREVFISLMETGQETIFHFSTAREASTFERTIAAIRYAFMHDKEASEQYRRYAPLYTAERSEDGLSIRLCSTENTRAGKRAQAILNQQAEQFKAAGVDFPFQFAQSNEPKAN